ncbi:hypothetical protein A9K55_008598 [Cordyceps militaris]|uniref:Uncharacterized protein n=1 Tax=Cordyceps militaris TaxID=73501 RepID=A0A2H4SJV4_CORMI|nr:hypothetical protein A9K55_008598 [Cordyceps militaris]
MPARQLRVAFGHDVACCIWTLILLDDGESWVSWTLLNRPGFAFSLVSFFLLLFEKNSCFFPSAFRLRFHSNNENKKHTKKHKKKVFIFPKDSPPPSYVDGTFSPHETKRKKALMFLHLFGVSATL